MIKPLLIITLTTSLFAQWYEIPHTITNHSKAKKMCREHGKGWRLPTIEELFSLKGKTEQFSKNESFWASNLVRDGISIGSTGSEGEGYQPNGRLKGYSFYLQDGDISTTPLNKEIGVICTNQDFSLHTKDHRKGPYGVVDHTNDIIWMDLEATNKKKRYSYEKAIEQCETLSYLGRSWRLPTLDELFEIVDYTRARPTLNTQIFGMMMHRYYWSEDEFNDNEAYVVGFKFGSVATSSKKNRSYVRCVSDLD